MLENVVIDHNTALWGGGGIYTRARNGSQALPVFINCTIADNISDYDGNGSGGGGGLITVINGSGICTATVKNSIFWNNKKNSVFQQLKQETSTDTIIVINSNIQGGWLGSNNMDTLPMFIGGHVGNYNIDKHSPMISMGDSSYSSQNLTIGQTLRKIGAQDIGAYEYDGVFIRGSLPTELDDIVLKCINELNFPAPPDGVSYALYNDSLTVLIGGPITHGINGDYITTPNPIMGDTSFTMIVGRDASYGIDFSGSNGTIEVPHDNDHLFDVNSIFKIDVRIKPNTVTGRQRFWSKLFNIGVGLEDDGLIFSTYGYQDIIFPSAGITIGQWHNISIEYIPFNTNIGILTAKVDGEVIGIKSIDRFAISSTSISSIGGSEGLIESFDGEMDYLSIFKNNQQALQFDFLSGQGSNEAFDLKMAINGGAAQDGVLNGLNRYQVWLEGQDAYVKLAKDTLVLNVLINPETITRFVMNKYDDGYASLRQRVAEACPLDTIRFATVMMGDTIKFESEIFLGKDLFIEGLGMDMDGTILDGQNLTQLFNSQTNRAITFKDLQMIRGVHTTKGGAFHTPNDCTLWNVRMHSHNPLTDKNPLSIDGLSNLKIKGEVILED
ncbi:MAG: hypothetical protein V3V14_01490 [Saprospiraceae bacterium]